MARFHLPKLKFLHELGSGSECKMNEHNYYEELLRL